MYSKEAIGSIVKDAIKAVTGKDVFEPNVCLLDRNIAIFPADFLYIFDIIENKIGKSISNILVDYQYDVFIMENFVNAVYSTYVSEK